jgi:ProP effector
MTDTLPPFPETIETSAPVEAAASEAPVAEVTTANTPAASKRPPRPDVFPVLEKMAALYPQLFGAVFRPLKRGIFQDLLQAHPDAFERESLKAALSMHTRSTRYLTAVAAGEQRFDLQGQAVEAMAPEHVHHALLEVFRRRQMRSNEGLRPKLMARIVAAFEASGLDPLAYAELVRSRDEGANAVLDEAMAEAQARAARTEALLQAFKASGKTVEEFADMYGMDPRAVSRMLPRAPAGQA